MLGIVAVESYYGVVRLPRLCSAGWMIPVWFIVGEFDRVYIPVLSAILWGLTFFTLINFCVKSERLHHWAGNRIAVWLANVGLFSYSIYLVHYPVQMLIREASPIIANPPNVWIAIIVMAVKLVAGFYAGKLFFYLVERRFLNKPVKFRSIKSGAVDDGTDKYSKQWTQPDALLSRSAD